MVKHSVIIPVFNESAVVKKTYTRLKSVMDSLGKDYELIFINDGSNDTTPNIIQALCKIDQNVKLISFSRNFGHQIAISAGLDYANGDTAIIIDADLQDPPEIIPEMIKKWDEGYEVVYGKRIKRKGETLFKKTTAFLFYRLLKNLTNYEIPVDTGDFRLVDRKVLEVMKTLTEKSRFMRGLVSWVGFKQSYVEYIRDERFAGETKYPLKRMLKFATDAITSFSYIPLRLASYLGFVFSVLSFLYLIYVIYLKFFTNKTILGWTSLLAVNLFSFGIVFIILGIIGEYIGRIYEEAKNRPLYIVREAIGFKSNIVIPPHSL